MLSRIQKRENRRKVRKHVHPRGPTCVRPPSLSSRRSHSACASSADSFDRVSFWERVKRGSHLRRSSSCKGSKTAEASLPAHVRQQIHTAGVLKTPRKIPKQTLNKIIQNVFVDWLELHTEFSDVTHLAHERRYGKVSRKDESFEGSHGYQECSFVLVSTAQVRAEPIRFLHPQFPLGELFNHVILLVR